MEINHLEIFVFTNGSINIINLTSEEKGKAYKYDSFENLLYTLEDKYGFKVSQSQWVTTEILEIYHHEDGKLIEK